MHREAVGLINYGQRGRRGYAGTVAVNNVFLVDSEGDVKVENVGSKNDALLDFYLLKGVPGEPGRDGDISDVIVNGESVVSEGVANITIGNTLQPGDNITISEGIISAIDTTYTAGDNISIENNVISAEVVDKTDEDILVTTDVGNYYAGDIIPKDTPLKDIIKNMFYKETPPAPPTVDTWYWWASNDVPTEIPGSASSKTIDATEVAREGITQYFTTNRQHATIAYPASMGNLTSIFESDFIEVLEMWGRVETVKDGVPYLIYYNVKTKSNNLKEKFSWR